MKTEHNAGSRIELLLEKIECPGCYGRCTSGEDLLRCTGCNLTYPIVDGIIDMRLDKEETYWDDLYHEGGVKGVLLADLDREVKHLAFLATQAKTADIGAQQTIQLVPRMLMDERIKASWAVEIGCGSGSTSLLLQMMGLTDHSILIDSSRVALLKAQRLFGQVAQNTFFIQADAFKSPVRSGSCDLAHSGGLIEHFIGDDMSAIVEEHWRVADRVVIVVPANSLGYWIGRNHITLTNGLKWPFGFERPLSRAQLFSLLEKSGGKVIGYRSRSLLQAMLERVAVYLPRILRDVAYRLSALGIFSVLKMEHIVLAVSNSPRHFGPAD